MRRSAGVVFAIATVGLTPALAHAEGGYEAALVSQAPAAGTPVPIESGEVIDVSAQLRNVGTATWISPLAQIGTAGAALTDRDRVSAFQAGTWRASNRITALVQPTVAPGEEGTFRFQLKGPPTTTPVKAREVFAPLQDPAPDGTTGGGWMDGSAQADGLPFGGLGYDLEVRPSEPPTATIAAAPAAVLTDQPVPVTATAADNVRVTAVAARIDAQPVVPLAGDPAQGTLPTAGIAPGAHTLTVAAVDGAGNVGLATAPLTITEDTGLPNGTPAGLADLSAGLSKARRSRLSVAAGKTAELGGRLRVKGTKTPVAGAVLEIESRQRGSSRWITVKPVSTDRLGRYQTRIPAGPSRAIRVVYRAQTKQSAPTVARTVRVETRAPVTLRVIRRGRVVRMVGRVTGSPFPAGGVLVSLQGKQAGDRWRPALNVRARGKQRSFSGRYRFGGGGRFKLRAVVNEQSGYPYARGTSRVRSVRIR